MTSTQILTGPTARLYDRYRREGRPAHLALAQARYETQDAPDPLDRIPDGYRAEVEVAWDEMLETGFDRGTIDWCDRIDPGAVGVYSDHDGQWQIAAGTGTEPERWVSAEGACGPFAETVASFRRKGMGRHDAWLAARKVWADVVAQDVNGEDSWFYGVRVYRACPTCGHDVEAASAYLGGVDTDEHWHGYGREIVGELVDECLAELSASGELDSAEAA